MEHLCNITILPFLVLPFLLILLLPLFHRNSHPISLLPSPPRIPIIGHLHHLTNLPHQSFYNLSQHLGSIFSLSLGSIPCIVACSSSAAREFLKTHDSSFTNRPHTKAVSILTYGSSNFSFAPYGSFWRFTKRLYMMELFSSKTLEQFRPIRCDEIRRLIAEIHAKAKESECVDLGAEVTRMTSNVTTRMAVSRRCSGTNAEADEVTRMVMETTELLGKFNVEDYLWFCKNLNLQGFDDRLKDLHRRFDGLMERIMKEKEDERRKMGRVDGENEENSFKVKDLLDILMDISEDEKAKVKLTRDNVKAFIRVSFHVKI